MEYRSSRCRACFASHICISICRPQAHSFPVAETRHSVTDHTLTIDLPMGDPDKGAEVRLEITFRLISGGLTNEPDRIEFVSCVGLLEGDAYDDHRQNTYDHVAEMYLDSDVGTDQALLVVAEDQ